MSSPITDKNDRRPGGMKHLTFSPSGLKSWILNFTPVQLHNLLVGSCWWRWSADKSCKSPRVLTPLRSAIGATSKVLHMWDAAMDYRWRRISSFWAQSLVIFICGNRRDFYTKYDAYGEFDPSLMIDHICRTDDVECHRNVVCSWSIQLERRTGSSNWIIGGQLDVRSAISFLQRKAKKQPGLRQ